MIPSLHVSLLTAILLAASFAASHNAGAADPSDSSLDDIPQLRQEAQELSAEGKYRDALVRWQKILSIQNAHLEPDAVVLGQSLANLAAINLHLRNYKEALDQSRKAIAIVEKSAGAEHPSLAFCHSWSSQCQDALGAHSEAEASQARAVKILKQAWGPESPDTLKEQNKLGALLASHGKYDAAATLLAEVLQSQQNINPSDSEMLGETCYLLGGVFHEQKKYAESIALLQRALDLNESRLGKDAPTNCRILDRLAKIHVKLGDLAKAEEVAIRALSIAEKTLPKDDSSIADSANNLAIVCAQQGKRAQAIGLYQRALELKESLNGADSPEVAAILLNLGTALSEDLRYAEAEVEYGRCLEIFERKRGVGSVEAAQVVVNWANLYKSQGRFAEAEPLYRRGLAVLEKTPLVDVENYSQVLDNAAHTLEKVGKPDDAAALRLRAQSLRLKN